MTLGRGLRYPHNHNELCQGANGLLGFRPVNVVASLIAWRYPGDALGPKVVSSQMEQSS